MDKAGGFGIQGCFFVHIAAVANCTDDTLLKVPQPPSSPASMAAITTSWDCPSTSFAPSSAGAGG
jgi:hypothetical protein